MVPWRGRLSLFTISDFKQRANRCPAHTPAPYRPDRYAAKTRTSGGGERSWEFADIHVRCLDFGAATAKRAMIDQHIASPTQSGSRSGYTNRYIKPASSKSTGLSGLAAASCR